MSNQTSLDAIFMKRGANGAFTEQRLIKLIAVGVSLILLTVGIWQFMAHQKKLRLEEASSHYEAMMQAMRQKNNQTAKAEAEFIIEQHAKTPYAPLSALFLARFSLEKGNLQQAIEHLKFALAGTTSDSVKHIARVRLARVLAQDNQYEEALKILSSETAIDGYVTLYEEAKGDIYLKQNQIEKAKIAYEEAIKAAPANIPMTALQLKYNDIAKREDS